MLPVVVTVERAIKLEHTQVLSFTTATACDPSRPQPARHTEKPHDEMSARTHGPLSRAAAALPTRLTPIVHGDNINLVQNCIHLSLCRPHAKCVDTYTRKQRLREEYTPATSAATRARDTVIMSKIDRMQIQGIRSFGPGRGGETIRFNTPLTLIVGWNGSGKTTIIECLKYATTGELPPNSKTGGAFIHDPTLRNEKEMMAQVKLAFQSTSGANMVATRSMQATVKKSTRTQKTLDGCLEMRRDGIKETISSRVAELDSIIPMYLGVSKAILENVIFCHQDDSLWPMSESGNLKKKFDSIFEADKYTKAIDNIKIIRKTQASQLAVFKANEAHAKENKIRGEASEKKQASLAASIQEKTEEYEKFEALCSEAHVKSSEAFARAARFEQIIGELNSKRIAYQTNEENIVSLEENLKMMAETDEELESMLERYEERVQHFTKQTDELKGRYSTMQDSLQRNRNALGTKQSEIGKFEAERDQHDRNVQRREALVREAAKRHGIRHYDYDLDDAKVAEFLQQLSKLSRDQDKTLERARKDAHKELQVAQAEISRLGEQKSTLVSRKEMAKSQIATNDSRISELQTTMNKIRVDDGAIAIFEAKKNDTEKELEQAIVSADQARYDERVQQAEQAGHDMDMRKERLENELVDATKSASESAQIDFAQNKLKNSKHSLDTMKNVHSTRISQLVDPDWELATLEDAFNHALGQRQRAVKEAESLREIDQSKLDKVHYNKSTTESNLKKKESEFQRCERTVLDAVNKDDIADFEEALRDIEEEYDMVSSDKAKFEAQVDYMQQCLETAFKHNACRLCRRSLKDDRAEDFTKAAFIKSLEDIIAKAKGKTAPEEVEELFAEVESARDAKPSYESALRARDEEIPALQAELEKLNAERDTLNKQLEKHDGIIHDLETAKQEVESLSMDVQSIAKYYTEVQELESQIASLQKKQKLGGLSRGIEAVRADLQKVTEENRSAKAALSNLTNEREKSRKLINTLEIRIRDYNADLTAAQASLKEKQDLGGRIEELRTSNTTQNGSIRSVDEEIQTLTPEIETARIKYDDTNRRGNERVQRIHDEAAMLSDSVRQLADKEQEIDAYIDKGGMHLLSRAENELQHYQSEIRRVEEDMVQITREVKRIEKESGSTEQTKQSIFDNLRYRRANRVLQTLAEEIQHLESKNAENDQAHWNAEGQHWREQQVDLNSQAIQARSAAETTQIQLTQLVEEYKQEYEDAARNYREMHIKVETTKAACEDLARYGTALDQAIMKFHSIKMEEINRIIEELWRNAYQGTDVDTVKIVSDKETARANRQYNYRVVMIKSGVPMDMRGRCSAGQKVLASIIIRLALAECFGANCGLIALDEPTTNLDQQNIQGLAESLSQIIRVRRKQKNFQLLVITHDEQFLREMNCAEWTDVYWRVGRDASQQSYIERQNIAEVYTLPNLLDGRSDRTAGWKRAILTDELTI
ncbi:unnamed protein product [Periconia digitata]|uniref:DNA repair protein RAD50 n=1 Tax=Periconia digitata TaxID=1303443 RepID=A0A9W4U375_9PLEO|nr:unnamed protein product [Periconia digitata]